jgi:hypothetical protein
MRADIVSTILGVSVTLCGALIGLGILLSVPPYSYPYASAINAVGSYGGLLLSIILLIHIVRKKKRDGQPHNVAFNFSTAAVAIFILASLAAMAWLGIESCVDKYGQC